MKASWATTLLALTMLAACGSDSPERASEVPEGRSPTSATTPATTEAAGGDSSVVQSDDEPATSTTAAAPPQIDVGAIQIELVEVAQVEQPLDIDWHPDGTGPFVASKTGRWFLLDGDSADPVLDLTDKVATNSERGLLSVEFSPDGAHVFVHWSDLDGTNVLTAWPWAGTEALAFDDGVEIMRVAEPYSNHNGGGLAFGPDGMLYWGLGDGGSGGDPERNGQNPFSLLGSVVRIDPDPVAGGYSVPPDNPFADGTNGAPEVWVYGLRNPWRMSFAPDTGDLWIGDVGQNEFEEIDRVGPGDGGANLGWNCFEGFAAFEGCDVSDHHEPVVVYDRDLGQSVTGGVVYQGSIEGLGGQYVFGDYGSGRVWALDRETTLAAELGVRVAGVVGFATAPDGELWVASITEGVVGYLR